MPLKNFKKQYQKIIHEINEFEKLLNTFTDSEIRVANFNLQKQYLQTQRLNDLISKSFALTREASLRTLGLRHYDVQLVGGLSLNNNKIAEMKTGEGKTLVATLPASLNGITKKGVHIVTVNDYLTTRDYSTMNKLYRFLGLSTGLIQSEMSTKDRKLNYSYNITYVPNSELAFDFLKDNTVLQTSDIVFSLPFNYCIIDEVDSILIDEAQTPVILASRKSSVLKPYIIASEIINYLELNKHYEVNEKEKNVVLTETGHKQVEKILNVKSLYDKRQPWISYIINALKATSLFFNNIHYIIQKNRIVIVDEFTGRTMSDRRWGEGLHQAIEAKEKLPISVQTETQASVTYQNYFLMYPKLSGMTGTGKTAEIEFQNIYNLSVELIPTFKSNKRQDLTDLIYKDQFSKWNAITKFCKKINQKGQPILIGTTTVSKSEMVSQLLKEYNLSYQLLNAKLENVKKEATIIAQAGVPGSITISTNMAGRGTDIILGGNINIKIQKTLYKILISTAASPFFTIKHNTILDHSSIKKVSGTSQKMLSILETIRKDTNFLNLSYLQILKILKIDYQYSTPQIELKKMIERLALKLKIHFKKSQYQKNKIVRNLGGLYVIGTERNDSRRIDNQLRGRCGRQGDPGISRFFISLEDTLLRLFGDKRITTAFNDILSDSPLESSLISKTLDSAQQQVEERAFEQRKNLFKYDNITNEYKQIINLERLLFLTKSSLIVRKNSYSYAEQIISEFLELFYRKSITFTDLILFYEDLFEGYFKFDNFDIENWNRQELHAYVYNEFWLRYQLKVIHFNILHIGLFENLERQIILSNFDELWKESLQTMQLVREATGWRPYGGKTPASEYFNIIKSLFSNSQESLMYYTIFDLLKAHIL